MSLFLLLLTVAGVTPKLEYQLHLKAQEFAQALINGESREIYRLFVPAFRREVDFSRFDSALKAWQAGQRIVRVQSKVVDRRGLGGHASTYVYLQGASDYQYVYQNWIYTDDGWELTWLSNILDQSFLYGVSDTVNLKLILKKALDFFLSPEGWAQLRLGKLTLPETIVGIKPDYITDSVLLLSNHYLYWRSRDQIEREKVLPELPFCCEFGVIKNFGEVALTAISLINWPHYQGKKRLRRPRGMEIYLKKEKDEWQVHSVGKRW